MVGDNPANDDVAADEAEFNSPSAEISLGAIHPEDEPEECRDREDWECIGGNKGERVGESGFVGIPGQASGILTPDAGDEDAGEGVVEEAEQGSNKEAEEKDGGEAQSREMLR